MPSDREILSAARTVQSELDTLLGAEAERVAPEFARLIAQVETGQADSFDLEDFLAGYDATRDRMAELLNRNQTLVTGNYRYDPLAGNVQIATAQQYTCPQCDYLWYRRDAGQDIPQCPTHNVTLIPAQNP